MPVQPIRDQIVVSKEEGAKTTASGLYIPNDNEKVVRGKVLAVGSGRVTANGVIVPLEVKVGDIVAFNKNFATELIENGESFLVLREDQILGKF